MVRRLTHIPECEGSIPTGYSYFRHHFYVYILFEVMIILFLVYFNLMDS